jgi:hypothetical protein
MCKVPCSILQGFSEKEDKIPAMEEFTTCQREPVKHKNNEA